jgi:site-specific recombinase XerD
MTMLAATIEEYLRYHAATNWRPTTVQYNRYALRRFVRYLTKLGIRRWSALTPEICNEFLLSLTAAGLSRSTRDKFALNLRGLGAYLRQRGLVLRDPAADLVVLEGDEQPLPPAPLSEEQVAAIFAAVPRRHVVDLRTRLHLELLYSCALRNAEAVGLDVGDLQMESRTLFVRITKGGVPRALPLMPGTLVAAGEYLALRRELLRGPDTGALLLSQRGNRLDPRFIQHWLKSASRHLGFRVHPHLLRHSIAVHLLRQRADVRHIQQFLGHVRLDTTKVYLRLIPGHLREDYDEAMPDFPIDPLPPDDPAAVAATPPSHQPGVPLKGHA